MALVSIISMVKNEEKHIIAAISSILQQSGVDIELIVIDDFSSDNTLSIMQSMALADERLHVYQNPGAGKVAAFKYGCSLATGKYLAFFAGDDIMPDGSLLRRLNLIETLKSPSVVVSKIQVMSEDKKIDGLLIPKAPGVGNPSGASIMIDRAAGDFLLDIPESLPNEDTWMDLCIRFVSDLNVVHEDGVACLWRVHSGNSITIKQGFDEFNRKFSARMKAMSIFLGKYQKVLLDKDVLTLTHLIECESSRLRGDYIRVLLSRTPFSDKVRMFFYSNKFLFSIRTYIRSI
ncbi:glycosyltransferase family 2 protein [Aeromonas veronii]